jgi:N-acetylmuramoyl-L-alanine amidase
MQLVYPLPGHQTYEASTFLLGSVAAGQQLWVNGQPVATHPEGYFAWQIPLQEGPNTFQLQAYESDQPVGESITCSVQRLSHLSEERVRALPFPGMVPEAVQPSQSVVLMSGQWLEVCCPAHPGLTVTCQLEDWPEACFPLTADPTPGWVDRRDPIFAQLYFTQATVAKSCFYTGRFQIPATCPPLEQSQLQLTFTSPAGHRETRMLEATVSVWAQPRRAVVTQDRALARLSPCNGDRWTAQPAGVSLIAVGRESGWVRVALNSMLSIWLPEDSIRVLNEAPDPPASVRLIHLHREASNTVRLAIPLSHPVPLHLNWHANEVVITLYGAESRCDFIEQDWFEDRLPVLGAIRCQQEADETVVIRAACPGLSGYDYQYTTDAEGITWLNVTIRTLPAQNEETVLLIDPGHGGEEYGSVGLSGIAEKTLNLTLSVQLAEALQEKGFQVVLTRQDDVEVSLGERAALCRSSQAHLSISVHHNALPDGNDPLQNRGVCCFYYQPHAHALAQTLQAQLVQHSRLPAFGLLFGNYSLTRIHEAAAVLVEVGYMIHPDDYAQLIDSACQEKAVQGLVAGIEQWVTTRRREALRLQQG